jgi:hypothetical protein
VLADLTVTVTGGLGVNSTNIKSWSGTAWVPVAAGASRYRLELDTSGLSGLADGTESLAILAKDTVKDGAGNVVDNNKDATGTLYLNDKVKPVLYSVSTGSQGETNLEAVASLLNISLDELEDAVTYGWVSINTDNALRPYVAGYQFTNYVEIQFSEPVVSWDATANDGAGGSVSLSVTDFSLAAGSNTGVTLKGSHFRAWDAAANDGAGAFVSPYNSLVASRYRVAIATDASIRPTDGTESFTIVFGSSIRDYAGNVLDASENTTGTLKLQDKKPPVFAGTYPAIGTAGGNAVPLKLKVDEDGTVHYVVLPKDDSAPTAAQVVAGTNAADAAVTNGTQSLTADTEEIKSVAGLASETDYDIYVVAKDAAGNTTGAFADPVLSSKWISSPIKLTVSTPEMAGACGGVISSVETVSLIGELIHFDDNTGSANAPVVLPAASFATT